MISRDIFIVEENSMSEGRVAACGQNASRDREPYAVAELKVLAQRVECPTPPSTKATNVEQELILDRNVRRSKGEGVAEGPLRALTVGR